MAAVQVDIERVSVSSSELHRAIESLLPQLSTAPFDAALVDAIVESDGATLLVARIGGSIVGMCTLATFSIPTGVRAWLEDVVVDSSARGAGVGEALVEAAVQVATERGARSVDLTSRPSREAAIRLYERRGFERRDTNVYRLSLDD